MGCVSYRSRFQSSWVQNRNVKVKVRPEVVVAWPSPYRFSHTVLILIPDARGSRDGLKTELVLPSMLRGTGGGGGGGWTTLVS